MTRKAVEEVTYTTKDGEKKTIIVRKPKARDKIDASVYSGEIFYNVIRSGKAILRSKLAENFKSLGLWDDEKEKKLEALNKEINASEAKLKNGGIPKLTARKIAIELRLKRAERTGMLFQTTQLDSKTLEGQCENVEFDFLVSRCLFNEDQTPVFSSVEEYLENEDEHIAQCASKLSGILYGIDEDWESKLPEVAFLVKYKWKTDVPFAKYEGKVLVLLDENGNKLNEKGEPLTQSGETNSVEKVEFTEFTDED